MGLFDLLETALWMKKEAESLKDKASVIKKIVDGEDGLFEKINAVSSLIDEVSGDIEKKLSEPPNGKRPVRVSGNSSNRRTQTIKPSIKD